MTRDIIVAWPVMQEGELRANGHPAWEGGGGDGRLPRLAAYVPQTGAYTRPLFGTTIWHNVSTFCGIRWVHDFPPIQ